MSEYQNSPYREIPSELLEAYTQNGQIPVQQGFVDQKPKGPVRREWSNDYLNELLSRFTDERISKNQQGRESYMGASRHLLTAFKNYNIHNKDIAVVGSAGAWIEAILLNLDNKVTTVEYNLPDIEGDLIKSQSYWDFEKAENNYDCIVTFSSVEHSGLGRYGDPLDPNGDIKTMKAIHQNLKEGGLVVWGAPVGADLLVWNAHRIYGRKRLELMFEGFEELSWIRYNKEALLQNAIGKMVQPVVVLKKLN
jgi:hypothetical protein